MTPDEPDVESTEGYETVVQVWGYVVLASLVAGGFGLGLLVGRWWALVVPIGPFAYFLWKANAAAAHSDVPYGIVVLGLALWTFVALLGGLAARHYIDRGRR